MKSIKLSWLIGILAGVMMVVAVTSLGWVHAANLLPPQNLKVPALAYDDTKITLTWEKPADYTAITGYTIYRNGQSVASVTTWNQTQRQLFYTVTGLTPNTSYTFTVRSKDSGGNESADSAPLTQTTTAAPTVYNITSYGAVGDGKTLNTTAIQNAINACPVGGKVLIPSGTFLSGALFLKSDMTLQIDGTLLGSDNPADYPYTSMRFPYYSTTNYMGLINAYTTSYGSLRNIRVCGSGTVNGGTWGGGTLTTLGSAEQSKGGNENCRGDMINVKGVNNLYLGGLSLVNPAMHTIFISYCNAVTVTGITASTYDIHNADGIDLATSNGADIFNCTFDTGDDCINFNAGVGAPGVAENYPDQNIRVFNCLTKRGHGGVVFGSFTAAWIKNVAVEECTFDGTEIGLRFKTGKEQGGGADTVQARDIIMKNIQKQAIFFDSTYSCDYPSASPGRFKNIYISNVTVTGSKNEGIYVNGLANATHDNINLTNITLSGTKGAKLTYCTNSAFNAITFVGASASIWSIANSSGLSFVNCSPMPSGYGGNTPTPTVTPRVTVTPTPTVKVSPTPTATVKPSGSPTASPTTAPTPTATGPVSVAFSDDFEDGNAVGWTATTGTWSVVQDSGSYTYAQTSTSEGRTGAGLSTWNNYAVTARVKVDNFNGANRVYLCARYQDGNNFYCASLYNSSGGTVEIRKKVSGSTSNLASKTNFGLTAGTWYTVKLEVNGSTINMYVNGTKVLTATDSALTTGGIGLITYKVTAKYDDVVVAGL